ncbi:hypothetical protein ACFC5H_17275 [Streptomyces rochei]|uniref:Uncharacterized protein n=3 Tax=Streptomyces TaxID=1883 RepID=A0AAX3ZQL1_STRRO|nr:MULTISPECIES: hypothetical protein [Streptomyces]MBQ0913348.1 hypothetical protein [Streptomyces sp. RM99]NEC70095.1 hypothetical protein [Streptomyces rochei]RSS31485.1 hypothetical protein EF916_01425 [Streptomyces sp. WAC08452]WMC89235.1 hypothetical protein P7W03_28140 [Streptomyces rochei]GGZ47865.1 hypothetical protein GCM10010301_20610 [Streptomyces plicatus]
MTGSDGTLRTDQGPATREPVPYREVTEDHYAPTYTAEVTVTPVDAESVVLSGRCPRCRCPAVFLHAPRTFRAAPRRAGRSDIPVICTCTTPHPDRPEDETGCGAYWNVRLERA